MAQIAYNDQNLLGTMRPGIICGNGTQTKYKTAFDKKVQQSDKF